MKKVNTKKTSSSAPPKSVLGVPNVPYKIPESQYARAERMLREFAFRLRGEHEMTRALFSPDPDYPVHLRWQRIVFYLFNEGLIARPRISFEETLPDEPLFYSLRLWAKDLHGRTDGMIYRNRGFSRGVSTDLDEAVGKVIGEFLERYPQCLYRDRSLLKGSISDLRKRGLAFLDPMLFCDFSDEQKKRHPECCYSEDSVFRWTTGYSLLHKKHVLMPAQLVHINYRLLEGERLIRDRTTGGAAGMFSKDEAALHGLYELIERDTFFFYWLNMVSPKRLTIETICHGATRKLIAELQAKNIRAHVLCLESDIPVPSFLVALIDERKDKPALALGCGTHENFEKAIASAFHEALGVRLWLLQRRKQWNNYARIPRVPFSESVGARDRMFLWSHRHMLEHFSFMLDGAEISLENVSRQSPFFALATAGKRVAYLAKYFAAKGKDYDIAVFHAKHSVLEKLKYHSVKVIVPALTPMYFNEKYAPLGCRRLHRADRAGRTKEIPNAVPHPFP